MGTMRLFEEEATRVASRACINDAAFFELQSYALALSTTTVSVEEMPPGIYRVFIEGMNPSLVVAVCMSGPPETVTLPATGTPPTPSASPVGLFPGSVVERLRIVPGLQTLNARVVSGSATLFLVPVGGE